jgi:hypothetical protein
MMGASNTDMTATTHQSERYIIDDNYMAGAVQASSKDGKTNFNIKLIF